MTIKQDQDDSHIHKYESRRSSYISKRLEKTESAEGPIGTDIHPMFAGIAAVKQENGDIEIGITIHDMTYSLDFSTAHFSRDALEKNDACGVIADFIISDLNDYQHERRCKFLGAGVGKLLAEGICPTLCPRLWSTLDIVPMVFNSGLDVAKFDSHTGPLGADEEADSVARKCVMYFGPNQQPRLEIGYRNRVEVDAGGRIRLATLEDYRSTVSERTWQATMKYAEQIKERNVQIAFFNSTPQGGGVALMRHALVRLLRRLGIQVTWYVPKPRPEVFRITKHNHNILQGVAAPGVRMSKEQGERLTEWINKNAEHYWLSKDGPLAARSQGGADVIFIDDPQMPGLIPLAKKADPDREVLFRSHIQVRSDLVAQQGSPTAEVWEYLWRNISQADLFISHPVREFVPANVPWSKVGYMPATTDWLDGLNKKLSTWDTRYYVHNFKLDCDRYKASKLDYPRREYIIQVARFDPAKGIPDCIESYAKLRKDFLEGVTEEEVPQLLITGVSAIDDPDGTIIYDQTMELLESSYPDISPDICVMRLGPLDQLLDALLSEAKIALQLSTREGFEVKVSEAIHKGVPVIVTQAGGIPLQVQHGRNGFIVPSSPRTDTTAVAKHMYELLTDEALYARISEYAKRSVSDEVHTVGNALSWLYLAERMSRGEKVEPSGRWINDMAREAAGFPYVDGETRLPRDVKT